VFPSQTKQFDRFVGPEIAAGFDRVALSQAVLGADDPAAEVRWFKRQLEHAATTAGNPPTGV